MSRVGWELTLFEEGSADASAHLRKVAENAEASREFFEKVGEILIEQSRRRWRNNGPGWARDAWATTKKKARSKDARAKANAGRVLRETGALERALTVWGAPGQKWRVTDDYAAFGIETGGQNRYVNGSRKRVADVWYGAISQAGRKGQPRRLILKATPATKRRVQEALRQHILDLDGR